MTQRLGRKNFPDLRWRFAAVVAVACLVQGCATSATEDTAPSAAATPAIAPAGPTPATISEVQLSSGEPRDTGTFPNLNIAPQAAAEQISAQQKEERLSELKAARTGQKAPPGSAGTPASNARLKTLASSHAAEALEEIENN